MEYKYSSMEKEELYKMEEELRNTTAGKFAELGKAIQQCGVSLDDVCKATQELGKAFNSVPPYQYRSTTSCVRGVLKTIWIVMCLVLLVLIALSFL